MYLLIAFLLVLPFFSVIGSEIVVLEPLSVDKIQSHWVRDLNNSSDQELLECRQVKEVKRAIVCLSLYQSDMNRYFSRASVFIEGLFGKDRGTLLSLNDYTYKYSSLAIKGHDLKGSDLVDFFNQMETACKRDESYCLVEEEKVLKGFVEETLRAGDFIVISTYSKNSEIKRVFSHELLHAQYFLDPIYQIVVNKFWDGLSEEEVDEIRGYLSRKYDVKDKSSSQAEFLLKNEFQAYILMERAEYDLLAPLVGKYKESLLKELEREGRYPLPLK